MLQTCPRGTLNEWVTTSDILDWQSFICLLGLSLMFARPSSLFTLHKPAMYKVELSCLTCCPLILLYFILGCSTCIIDNITSCLSVEFMSSSSSTVSSPTAKLRGTSSLGYKSEKLVYLAWCGAFPYAVVLSNKPYCVTRFGITTKDLRDIYTSERTRLTMKKWPSFMKGNNIQTNSNAMQNQTRT